jgi:hypothetical protein
MKRLIGLVGIACVVAACGGSATTKQTSSAPKQSADPNCNASQGAAAADSMVGQFGTAKFQVASVLADNFREMVAGKISQPGAPKTALCPVARQAAASVVLQWAARHQSRFTQSSAPKDGGTDVGAYLKAQGVACGSGCGYKQTAQDVQLQASAGGQQKQQEQSQGNTDAACTQALDAGQKFIRDVEKYTKAGSGSGGATDITGDMGGFAQALRALEPQATASDKAALQKAAQSLNNLEGNGGVATSLALSLPEIKSLPGLIGRVCND